ncbi:MAG: LysM peptidoglycan-binding domain-containing protein [Acidobacteriia bacterium]|nr:LysM peptidoglycan-binding domain-containing protein [Terriglobia bacterium]
MKGWGTTSVLLAAGILLLAGCQETGSKQVRVQPPAAAPTPAAAQPPAVARQPLPLPEHAVSTTAPSRDPRPAIDILVEKVQASFDAGQREEQAGNPAKAAADFDHALDLILKSGFQADSDPRLSKLFDQLGEELHSDELSVAAEGADELAPPAEPAVIDEIADIDLPEGDPVLARKAQNELIGVRHDLPLTVNQSVLQYLSFFSTTRGRAIVEHGLERAGRYSEMIRRVLREEGVPQDLIYLAQAESAFQPRAVSRSGARGIWQFMPFRGEQYDLERSYWVDERSDPEKATRAAARHMRDLYAMFGDWYLVMAAYNAGPGTVVKAVQRTGYADFWELQKRQALPKQTQNYVPIILALALVAKDPALYGVQIDPEKPPVAETISLPHAVSLRLAADASGADVDDLQLLNPQLLHGLTPKESGFELRLPAGAAKAFQQNIAQVPEDKWTSWRLHGVTSGETLAEIARQYRVTVAALADANHLDAHATVAAGFLLNVPTPPPAARLVRYRVQRGDTLEGIADRFDVTVEELKRWNHIRGGHVARGARLRIYAGGVSPGTTRGHLAMKSVAEHGSEAASTLEYRVKPGETLYSIARQYQTTVSALRQWNAFLAERDLQAGDVLTIRR